MPRDVIPRRSICVALLSLAALPAAGAALADAPRPAWMAECPVPADAGTEEWPGQHAWQALEANGYALGEIDVEVRDVYVGTSLPWYARLANALHINTQPPVIHSLLTVESGSPVDASRIYEAERALRDLAFLTDARIVPTRCAEGRVDAEVRVRDAWTLRVGGGFGSAGGQTSSSFDFREDNFIGTGKAVRFGWRRGRDRTTRELGYRDPAVLGSRWTFDLAHETSTDGYSNAATVAYPFRRADQGSAVRIEGGNERKDLSFEQAGDEAYSARTDAEHAAVEYRQLVARDGAVGWRTGVGFRRDFRAYGELEVEDADLRPPPELIDRRLQGPYLVLERFRDRFRSFRNLRRFGVTEDYPIGLNARLVGGRYADRGTNGSPWFTEVALSHGTEVGANNLLLAGLDVSGRYRPEGEWETLLAGIEMDYYHRTSPRNTIVTHVEFDWRDDRDPEDELYLGGADGLLGYPARFRVGDRRWLTHIEDRYTTDIILFDTIQIGYTAFLEAGAIRGLDGDWSRTLASAGAGLRLGSLRSSFGSVTYLSVAMPLVDVGDQESYEVVIGSTVNF